MIVFRLYQVRERQVLNFKVWFLAFSFSLFLFKASLSHALPTAEDVNQLAETAKLTSNAFMQESFELRMQYEYSDRFLNKADKDNLYKLAKRASSDLDEITKNQKDLKRQIEGYEEDDWDVKYGTSGLWRKLSSDIYTITLSKCEIDFHLALSSEQPQRNKTLLMILKEIDSIKQSHKRLGPILVKGKVLALLGQTKPSYKAAALKEFGAFAIYSDVYRPTKAAIERMKLTGSADENQLNILVKRLQQNSSDRYLELILSLAFLQRKSDLGSFEKIVQIWPQTEDFLGSLILSDLSYKVAQNQLTEQTLQQMSVFEAELAAQAAWKNETENYKKLLKFFSGKEKFQTPLTLYVAAVALADSSPAKTVELLIKAGRLQKIQKSDRLKISACKIAEQAAKLAYNFFSEASGNNNRGCRLALKTFENYSSMTGEKIDEELEYLYSIVLADCGQTAECRELLEKIANRPAGNYRNRAGLELAAQAIRQKQYKSSDWEMLLSQFSNLITESNDCQYTDEIMELLMGI